MNDWYSSIYKAFLITSTVLFIIYMFSKSVMSISALITGYTLLNISIAMILIVLFKNILNVTQNEGLIKTIGLILINTGPFLLMFGVIVFILYLLIFYRNIIIEEHVSQGFYSFSNILIILSLIQVYIVYTNVNSEQFDKTGKLPSITTSIVYMFGVLSSICSLIIYTILKYYTTDGFHQQLKQGYIKL